MGFTFLGLVARGFAIADTGVSRWFLRTVLGSVFSHIDNPPSGFSCKARAEAPVTLLTCPHLCSQSGHTFLDPCTTHDCERCRSEKQQ